MTLPPLPPPPISGPFWSIGVPAALFLISLAATWFLYVHFSRKRPR